MFGALLLVPLLQGASAQGSQPLHKPLFVLTGEGDQVYRCDPKNSGADAAGWVLDHPDAKLLDPSGAEVGTHGAGPTWRYRDGSVVKGELLVKTPAPDAGAIPWLVLQAASHEGRGAFAAVETIERTHTQGGVAPATGCDATHTGALVRVHYRATYSFFGEAAPAAAK
jgi:hypothetical protein